MVSNDAAPGWVDPLVLSTPIETVAEAAFCRKCLGTRNSPRLDGVAGNRRFVVFTGCAIVFRIAWQRLQVVRDGLGHRSCVELLNASTIDPNITPLVRPF